MSRIYLDHAATTPMVPEAVQAMTRELTRVTSSFKVLGPGFSRATGASAPFGRLVGESA